MSADGVVLERLDYRYLVAVDIEGFSGRNAREQAEAQDGLERALTEAAAAAGLDRASWHRQVGGDGELAVLPNDTDGLRLVAGFPRALARVLNKINHDLPRRVRIRVALHHGTLAPGSLGPVGRAPIVVSRLLDSDVLRGVLVRRPETDLALIVSATLFADVIETRFGGLDPGDYRPAEIHAKGLTHHAYIHNGHHPE